MRVADGHFEVSGPYGVRLPLESIVEVSLDPTMPLPRRRLQGSSAGGWRHGRFRVETLGEGFLYTRTGYPPYLLVRTPETFVLVNFRDAGRTRALHAELTAAVGFGGSLLESLPGCGAERRM